LLDRADEDVRGDGKLLVESADRLQREGALPSQHLVDLGERTDHRHQIVTGEAMLFRAELDRRDRIGRI